MGRHDGWLLRTPGHSCQYVLICSIFSETGQDTVQKPPGKTKLILETASCSGDNVTILRSKEFLYSQYKDSQSMKEDEQQTMGTAALLLSAIT